MIGVEADQVRQNLKAHAGVLSCSVELQVASFDLAEMLVDFGQLKLPEVNRRISRMGAS